MVLLAEKTPLLKAKIFSVSKALRFKARVALVKTICLWSDTDL